MECDFSSGQYRLPSGNKGKMWGNTKWKHGAHTSSGHVCLLDCQTKSLGNRFALEEIGLKGLLLAIRAGLRYMSMPPGWSGLNYLFGPTSAQWWAHPSIGALIPQLSRDISNFPFRNNRARDISALGMSDESWTVSKTAKCGNREYTQEKCSLKASPGIPWKSHKE